MEKALHYAHRHGEDYYKYIENYSFPGINAIGFSYEQEGKFDFKRSTNTACHAGLSYPGGGYMNGGNDLPHINYVVDIVYPQKTIEDHVRIAFIDYIMNCNAYSAVIEQDRTAEEIYEDGYVLARSDVPSNQLASCLISLRMARERPSIINNWWELVCIGMNKDVAFLLAHTVVIRDDMLSLCLAPVGHVGLHISAMGSKAAYNYINGIMVTENDIYSRRHDYHPVSSMWGDNGNLEKLFTNYLTKNVNKGKEEPYLFYRPKHLENNNAHRFKYDDECKQVLLEFSKKLEENQL